VGSIGLVLAVPLTTAIGVAVVRASGAGRTPKTQTGRAVESVRKQRPSAVKEQAVPQQQERQPAHVPEPREATTTKLPRLSRSPQPTASNEGEPMPSENQVKRRRFRRHDDDDFGDFTYLHEPIESEPEAPKSRGRRAL